VTRDEVIARLRAQEPELRRAGIRHVALFGSTARGAAHPGDVDLLIAFDDAKRYTLLDYSRVQRQLAQLLGTDVDLAFEPLQKERFRARVQRELVRAF
jgi:predicted nucleotidyltransferase